MQYQTSLNIAEVRINLDESQVLTSKVGSTGWTSMRAYHDQALIDEFQRRGIDVSAIYDGKAISFANPVRYDIAENRLITIG